MFKKMLSRKSAYIGAWLVVTLALSLLIQYAWPLLIFSVIAVAIFIPLPDKISASPSLRIILSVLLIFSAIQGEAVIGYLLGYDFSPFSYGIINALLAAGLAIVFSRPKIKWTQDDLWTFAVPTLVVGGLFFSMLSLTTRDNTDLEGAIIHKITTTTDESNHINAFALSIDTGGDMMISPTAYPSGWHVATAAVVSSFVDLSDKPFMNIAAAYYAMKLLGIFLAVASIMALFVAVSRLALGRYNHYYLLFALTTLFICLALFIPNSEINGFYNFLPQYAYFLLAFVLLLHIKNNEKIVLPLLAIFIMGAFVSWIISGLLLLGIVFVSVLVPRLAQVRLKNPLLISVLQFGILGVVLLSTFLIILPGGAVGRFIDTLEHPGGWIEGYNLIAYPVLFLLLVACGVLTSKSKLPLQFRAGLISFFAAVALVFIVTTLRGYGGEQMSYYWQKMLFPLMPVAVTVLVVLAVQRLSALVKHVAPVYAVVILSGILLAHTAIGQSSFDLSLRVLANQNFLHKSQNTTINKPIEDLYKNNHFDTETADRYIFITSGNYTLDQMVYQLMSRSVTNNAGEEKCLPPIYPDGGFYGDNISRLKDIGTEYCGHKVKIVVSNETIEQVKRHKDEKDLINIDTDF